MKKFSLFCALLVGIAVMTSCQKDQDTVTLKAVVDQNTKAYFGGSTNSLPYWDGNDRVYLKGYNRDFTRESSRLENLSTTFATISGVPISSVYCAIFPASAVLEMGTPNAGTEGTTAKITFKHDQEYIWDEANQRQRLEMPMGAVSTNNTLIFKNLCGILRVKVVNTSGTAFDVTRLSVRSEDGTFIAGDGYVTLKYNPNNNPDLDPAISMSQYHTYTVDQAIQLHAPEYRSMGTIPASSTNNSKEFDIIVPPFSIIGTSETNHGSITFDVETNHGYFTYKVDRNVHVDRNEITTITLTVNELHVNNHAYLIDGPTFNRLIKTLDGIGNVTKIFFNQQVGSVPTTPNTDDHVYVVRLEASNSPLPIYGYISPSDNTQLNISSAAQEIYANADCSYMYYNLPNLVNNQYMITFITEDVTNMSHFYAGCTNLTTIPGFGNFVTTNVETMEYMFDGCAAISALDLRSFNTQHLRPDGMKGMFKGCTSLQTLYLNYFTTEQITTMEDLFNGCAALTTLNLSSFNTQQVTNMMNMFNGCAALTTLNLSSFNTERVTNMKNLFNGCVGMRNLYLNNFNVSNADIENMVKDMANTASLTNLCTVYCPVGVESKILENDNGTYYSGLNESNGGNYSDKSIWDDSIEPWGGFRTGKSIVFTRPSSK